MLERRGQKVIFNLTLTYNAYNLSNQFTHQWGPATCPCAHLCDSFGVMSGRHISLPGDPGAWNRETIPAAFRSLSPEVTTKRNPSLGPGSATLSRAAGRAR